MKTKIQKSNERGFALAMVLILMAVALLILASVMVWSSSSAQQTHRSIQYTRSVAAAEGATEKIISQVTHDFLYGGENLVENNLNAYRATVPTPADSAYWSAWVFNDGQGNNGATYVQYPKATNYVVLNSTYAGLKGYVSTFTVASHARETDRSQDLTGGVMQQLQLTQIPIFQFAMYSSGDMEISCGQAFSITGPVHSNHELFVEPDSALTFDSGVTAVMDILFQRDPLDPRGLTPYGGVDYVNPDEKVAPVAALTLPIGTTNTPEGIREIIEVPPAGEDPNSQLGRLRYYNESDLIVMVSDTGVDVRSGEYNNFATSFSNDAALFVSTTNSFLDSRENKNVQPVDIDVGNLTAWSETNVLLHSLIGSNLTAVYVRDDRNLNGNLNAVRVLDGKQLPRDGLTVATSRPMYVLGDYNELNDANLGTSNTSTTRPASLVADAITILSDGWQDSNSRSTLSSRGAQDTTVNAAFLTGDVETTTQHYSGGMENFPRFLETWGPIVITYNGSLIKMFPSLYATNAWQNNDNIYTPPTRNWAYDNNFNDPTKLPPRTPSLLTVARSKWTTVPPGQNVATATP